MPRSRQQSLSTQSVPVAATATSLRSDSRSQRVAPQRDLVVDDDRRAVEALHDVGGVGALELAPAMLERGTAQPHPGRERGAVEKDDAVHARPPLPDFAGRRAGSDARPVQRIL